MGYSDSFNDSLKYINGLNDCELKLKLNALSGKLDYNQLTLLRHAFYYSSNYDLAMMITDWCEVEIVNLASNILKSVCVMPVQLKSSRCVCTYCEDRV